MSNLDTMDLTQYGKTRNFIDGHVTRLSPYISHGVVSTRKIYEHCVRKYSRREIHKYIQELAWRDYWQRKWQAHDDLGAFSLPHYTNENHNMPKSVLEAKTGIEAIDKAIVQLYETGYMHNHVRMYVASICCNIFNCHWRLPAKWLYYHLFDADWASNALSWQWVAGASREKKYYANQDNINTFCHTDQSDTFLDADYEDLPELSLSEKHLKFANLEFPQILPMSTMRDLNSNQETLLYTWYNLDPHWLTEGSYNRVLILEPSFFQKYPVSESNWSFFLKLANNISGLTIYVGEFSDLLEQHPSMHFQYKEHPTNNHFAGLTHERDWMSPVEGDFKSFFAFWKKCNQYLRSE
ncbi:hypothetical protein N9D31_00380 [Oligoflexaceae bacterium]|nr:hypothetical protein [Oligoflexaceae bacterium]